MFGQTQHSPVRTPNLPDKCPMTSTNLQACGLFLSARCWILYFLILFVSFFQAFLLNAKIFGGGKGKNLSREKLNEKDLGPFSLPYWKMLGHQFPFHWQQNGCQHQTKQNKQPSPPLKGKPKKCRNWAVSKNINYLWWIVKLFKEWNSSWNRVSFAIVGESLFSFIIGLQG